MEERLSAAKDGPTLLAPGRAARRPSSRRTRVHRDGLRSAPADDRTTHIDGQMLSVVATHLPWLAGLSVLGALVTSVALRTNVVHTWLAIWVATIMAAAATTIALFGRPSDPARNAEERAAEARRTWAATAMLGITNGWSVMLEPFAGHATQARVIISLYLLAWIATVAVLSLPLTTVYAAATAPTLAYTSLATVVPSPTPAIPLVGALAFIAALALTHTIGSRSLRSLLERRIDQQRLLDQMERRTDEVERRNADLRRTNEIVSALARRDDLTGVANRRTFLEELDIAQQQRRSGAPVFSLAILDIDHFKAVNDTYGHLMGDTVLRLVVDAVLQVLVVGHDGQDGDRAPLVGRLGGEEFGVLFYGVREAPAAALLDAARRRVFATVTVPGTTRAVALSAGVVESRQEVAVPDMLSGADRALYRAKESGRNQVVRATDTPLSRARAARAGASGE